MRTIFGHKIRKCTTGEFWPSKLSLDEFVDAVKGIDMFKINMNNLGGIATEPRYIEKWFELFMAWSEVEKEADL